MGLGNVYFGNGTYSMELSAAATVGRYTGIGDPDGFGERALLEEDIDGDAAAGIPITGDAKPLGFGGSDQALGDIDGAIFMESTVIAEGSEIELEGFAFDEEFVGDVIDDDIGEIGLAGDGTERSKFGAGEADEIVGSRVRVIGGFKDGFLGRGKIGRFMAEQLELLGHVRFSREYCEAGEKGKSKMEV